MSQASRNSAKKSEQPAATAVATSSQLPSTNPTSAGTLQAGNNNSNQSSQVAQQQQQQQSSAIVKDIASLRKQIVSHPWFLSMEDILNKQFIPRKSTRKFKSNQKIPSSMSKEPSSLRHSSSTKLNAINLEPLQLQSAMCSSFPQYPIARQFNFLSLNNAYCSNLQGSIDVNPSNTINLTIPPPPPTASAPSAGLLNFMKTEKVLNSNTASIILGGNNNAPNLLNNISSSNQSDDPELEFEKPEMKNFSYTYSYTQQDRKKEITIKLHDLKKLLPNQYLNDSIVNFFLKFFEVEMLTEQMQEKVLIFNTYFMSKLAPNEQIDSISSSEPAVMLPLFEKNYQTVRRWIKEDIFEKEFLVFPLNLPEHWSVAIVCNHRRLLEDEKEKIINKKKQDKGKKDKMDVEGEGKQEKKIDGKEGVDSAKKNKEDKKGGNVIEVIDGQQHEGKDKNNKMEEEAIDLDAEDAQKHVIINDDKQTGSAAVVGNVVDVDHSESNMEIEGKKQSVPVDAKQDVAVVSDEQAAEVAATTTSKTVTITAEEPILIEGEGKGNEVKEIIKQTAEREGGKVVVVLEEEEEEEEKKAQDGVNKLSSATLKSSLAIQPQETLSAKILDLGSNENEDEQEDDEDECSSDSDSSSYSEIDQTDNQNPCILYFDSFGLLDSKYSTMIRLYIQREVTHKLQQLHNKNKHSNNNTDSKQEEQKKHIEVNELTLPSRQPLIPRQTNYVDCGLYLLEYVEDFLNSSPSQRSVFTSNSSDDWVQLEWFPRCNITSKRRFIKELILDLSKLPVKQAVENYKQKRQVLLDERSGKASEYDEVDLEEFEDHLEDIIESEYDYPETDMERHRMLLDFYMNPSYNKYEVV